MTIVNSWNEWDPLRHVIVGTVENANVPPMEPALEPKISKIVEWWALMDLEVKSLLKKQIYS